MKPGRRVASILLIAISKSKSKKPKNGIWKSTFRFREPFPNRPSPWHSPYRCPLLLIFHSSTQPLIPALQLLPLFNVTFGVGSLNFLVLPFSLLYRVRMAPAVIHHVPWPLH